MELDLHCKTCTLLSCGKCYAIPHQPYVHTLSACPINKWGTTKPSTTTNHKKILWITQDFAQGGITSYITYAVPNLAKSDTPVLAVLHLTDYKYDSYRASLVTPYCPIYRLGEEPDSLYLDADIITLSYVYADDIKNYLRTKLNRKQYYALVHQAHGECDFTKQSIINQKEIFDNCLPSLHPRIGLAPTPYSQRLISNLGVNDTRTLYYGLDQQEYPVKAIRPFYVQSNANYSPEPIKFICAGRLDPHKRYDLSAKLVQEFRASSPNYPPFANATLTVVGDGWARDAVLSSLSPYPFVTHVPWLDTPDLLAAFHNHDVFLMHSTNEGGPVVTVEALSCGLPVHSTPVGVSSCLSSLDPQRLLFDSSMSPLLDFVKRINSPESICQRPLLVDRIKKLFSPKTLDFTVRVAN